MLGYGHARDARVCSPPDRASDRSDIGGSRVPSPEHTGPRGDHGHAGGRRVGRSHVARRWQEDRRARVDRSPAPRPPDILKPRPVLPEPRERDDPGHPRPTGYNVDGEGHVIPHGERAVTEPTGPPDPVDNGATGSVEPPPVRIWDGLPDLCGGPETLPWCCECFTDRRRTQACPWGALTRVVVESAGDGPEYWGGPSDHGGTSLA